MKKKWYEIRGNQYSPQSNRTEAQYREYVYCEDEQKRYGFQGRLTDYLMEYDFDEETLFYLCGNSEMIFDAIQVSKNKGYSTDQMFTEVYF